VTNLQEVTGPLYGLFHSVQESGTIVARQMYVLLPSCLIMALLFADGKAIRYNCSGWVSHHNTDLYGDSAPQVSSFTAIPGCKIILTFLQDNYASSTWWPSAGPYVLSSPPLLSHHAPIPMIHYYKH